ncbi:hypothetical protein ACFQ2B_13120 [Streptomyces stramineus]
MNPMRFRAAGATAVALLLTAGAVAVAAPASAKAHTLTLGAVTPSAQARSAVAVGLTYICDTGSDVDIVTAVTGPVRGGKAAVAAVTVPNSR